jgi:5-methylthioadenosine/S-adenosylhomocysteine deaminase
MIRQCTDADVPAIEAIINDAAQVYRGVIPSDCWHEPYMSRADLIAEIADGVSFWGWDDSGELGGVMGLQRVSDVTLIRHAYVRPTHQGRGVGGALLTALRERSSGRLLVGTWAAARWAIRFYEDHGFRLVSSDEKDGLLRTYWNIPARQRETSVVLSLGPSKIPLKPVNLTRRQLLAGAGGGAAALFLERGGLQAQTSSTTAVVFSHTTVVTVDAVHDDVALAVDGDKIAAIGPTDAILKTYPRADVYDGRGKALLPGLINCHAHMAAVLARGFNEDFGFPNSAHLTIQPTSLLQREDETLMVSVAALEAIRTGTTTIVENTGNISRSAAALAQTGLRCVFAESVHDSENVAGPMSRDGLAKSENPRFSARLREEGLQRVNDLFTTWHGAKQGRISVFPAAALAETSSPELLRAVRDFAEKHDLGYTIHLAQSRPEVEFMVRYHGVRPSAFLDKHGFLGPRLFAAHCRYVDEAEIALLGRSGTIVTHQAAMAANRGVIPPIPALRQAGCPIANGTDNNTNDMFEVMRVALLTERIRRNDEIPGLRPQPEDVLEDATQGGARAVRQGKLLGSLEVGKKADLIVLDTRRPHLVPAGRIVSAWIHNGQPADIEAVMVDGQFIMRNRKVLTMDEDAIINEADAVGRRIWHQVLAAGPLPLPGRSRQR